MKWKVCLILLSLLAATGLTWLVAHPDPVKLARDEQARLAGVFVGDAQSFESLRAMRDQAVVKMEGFLRQQHRLAATNLTADLGALAGTNVLDSRLAEARLTLAPAHCEEWLRQRCDEMPESQAKSKLKAVLANRARARKQITGFLSGLYTEHFNRLFLERNAALERDCHDFEAQLFFAYAPFEETWRRLRNAPAEQQLRFLLFRVFAGRDQAAVDWLQRYAVSDILSVAQRTWWPVEIESGVTNVGPGYVIRAADLGSNAATQVLRVNFRPAPPGGNGLDWSSIERWSRWVYVFRFKEAWNGRSGVAYQEGRGYRPNRASQVSWGLPQEWPEDDFWLPGIEACPVAGPGKCETVRVVPASMTIPVAAVTRQEAGQWMAGSVYAWSRPIFSPAIQPHLRFESNRYPAPRVFASMEEARQPQPRRRPARTP